MRRAGLAAAAVVVGCLTTLRPPPPVLLWNLSPSAPLGAWLVIPGGAAHVGDHVAVKLPPEPSSWAAERGYVGRRTPLIKEIAAGAGQTVCRRGPLVTVDGAPAALAAPVDRRGRPLPAWSGCLRLGETEVFLLNRPPWSLDGRYLGATSRSDVLGRAVRLRGPA